jgi:hypothetical protein
MAPWISSLVWTDYRLAVLLTVLVPLGILAIGFIKQNEPITKLMIIYWRVASLLAISAYLLIAAMPVGFVTGWLARLLIPVALWFWVDINESLQDQQASPLKFSLMTWRWSVSAYCRFCAVPLFRVLRCRIPVERHCATSGCSRPGALRNSSTRRLRPGFWGELAWWGWRHTLCIWPISSSPVLVSGSDRLWVDKQSPIGPRLMAGVVL